MLSIATTDRAHVTIDRAARAAEACFKAAITEDMRPHEREVFTRLAMRADRTVRLGSYEYLNEHELEPDRAARRIAAKQEAK